MIFPFDKITAELTPADLDRFKSLFTKSIMEFLPCDTVCFLPDMADKKNPDAAEHLTAGLAVVKQQGKPFFDSSQNEPHLFLPLWHNKQVVGVALLVGGDASLYQAPIDWLLAQSRLISREFALLKQTVVDPVSELLNSNALRHDLHNILLGQSPAEKKGSLLCDMLVLIEIYPRGGDAERGAASIARAASSLELLLGDAGALYHLGLGLFAQFWRGMEVSKARQMGELLLTRLQQAEFVSAHCAITPLTVVSAFEHNTPYMVLEQVWQVLCTARKRGTFALHLQVSKDDLDKHPLKPLSATTLSWFRKLWRRKERFAVLLVQQDVLAASNHFSKRLSSLLDNKKPFWPLNQRQIYIFLDGADERSVQLWIDEFKQEMKALAGATFSVGVAFYPCFNFKKSDIPLNARKALMHSDFLAHDAVTVFDAASLNISGDLYYNDGDLSKAVKEYRQGLMMAPVNLNLYNSIGVAYAQMNRPRQAISFFEQGLQVDSNNFMALYNLGLASLTLKKQDEAIDYLEQALKLDEHHFDLQLHLGRLYCETRRYDESITLLSECAKGTDNSNNGSFGLFALYRYLGEACVGSGHKRQAIAYLERATNLNARSPDVLSLLGEMYILTGEGDDIALALCSQAVVLDDTKAGCWYRLGLVQYRLGKNEAAIVSLKKSLRCNSKYVEAVFLLAEVYGQQGRHSLARQMCERVLRHAASHQGALELLRGYSARQ